jgi:hypothetical protein
MKIKRIKACLPVGRDYYGLLKVKKALDEFVHYYKRNKYDHEALNNIRPMMYACMLGKAPENSKTKRVDQKLNDETT